MHTEALISNYLAFFMNPMDKVCINKTRVICGGLVTLLLNSKDFIEINEIKKKVLNRPFSTKSVLDYCGFSNNANAGGPKSFVVI